MNILVFTSLWPNGERPNFGVFVKHRIAALTRIDGVSVRVVAPVPYFPKPLACRSFLLIGDARRESKRAKLSKASKRITRVTPRHAESRHE